VIAKKVEGSLDPADEGLLRVFLQPQEAEDLIEAAPLLA
jgi:hypothetical protein